MLARELATLNDPVLKTGSLDDCCVAAGQAERRLPVLDRAPANLEAHGSASSLGAFHGHLLSAGLFLMSRHDTTAICWQDGHDRFHRFPAGLGVFQALADFRALQAHDAVCNHTRATLAVECGVTP